ncbi:hypothetical protein C8Q75DRAFT_723349 [Abortiporus biennis]|nr:hypothetical protein C8Q75DRAFT_723349 [Abortiporus biennis]
MSSEEQSYSGKGKARDLPPSLPPLSFSPTEFVYGSAEWPSLAGPSSYDSTLSSDVDRTPSTPSATGSASSSFPTTPEGGGNATDRVLIRPRSLSNLSVRSRRSLSNLSVKLRFGGAKSTGKLARKLFKKGDLSSSPPSSPTSDLEEGFLVPPSAGSNLAHFNTFGASIRSSPWSRDFKPRTPLATPVVETDIAWGAIESTLRAPRPTDSSSLRTKGRSYSSPLPLPASPFDIVPLAPADIFAPIPVVVPNYFDDILPRELKLHVLAILVKIHEEDHDKRVQSSRWTAIKASSSRNKWVGRDKGIKELFKLSRVSRSWQTLVFDGQLWAKLDLRSFPKLPSQILCRLVETAGGFIKLLDLNGHVDLLPNTLINITDHLSLQSLTESTSHTHLTAINLQGCSSLSTRSLHHLLIRSPFVTHLCLKGLTAVTNTTCNILSVYCLKLISLDLSRCSNMTGEGIKAVAQAAINRREHLPLKELRLSCLRRITDDVMAALGKAAPYLEVLDLSGVRGLHNSSVEAFVRCDEEDEEQFEQVVHLTSREAGRDPTDLDMVLRRVTRLRHLNLSSCILLTDHACSHLAFAVPRLEYLELASIGPELRDDGVVRLLNTTPYIRRLDLEDATEISDNVLITLTPSPSSASTPGTTSPFRTSPPPPPEPGHALEHLIISYSNVNNEALTELVRNCTKLRVLEADNTRMTGLVLREFVQLSQQRQIANAKVVAIDCRGVGEYVVKELVSQTRPRLGWRSWHARKLGYLDGRDDEGLNVGQDECDPSRVVVKTFYSWQTVDAVKAAREKKRKSSSRRGMNSSNDSTNSDELVSSSGRARWWSPGGRRSTGPNTPTLLETNGDRESCTIM